MRWGPTPNPRARRSVTAYGNRADCDACCARYADDADADGSKPTDPLMLGGAAALLLAVAVAASWLPARRAGRVDPASVLSAE